MNKNKNLMEGGEGVPEGEERGWHHSPRQKPSWGRRGVGEEVDNISKKKFPSCISYYDTCGSWYYPRALCLSCLVRHKVLTEPPGDAQRHLPLPLKPRANW